MKKIILVLAIFLLGNFAFAGEKEYQKIFDDLKNQKSEKIFSKDKIIQGKFEAKYIGNGGDYTKKDYIETKIDGKKYKVIGPSYKCFENGKNIKDYYFDSCKIESINFNGFSPSGYYFYYSVNYKKDVFIPYPDGIVVKNSQNGNSVFGITFPFFMLWTKDKKQFIYSNDGSRYSGCSLKITIKGSFPKTEEIVFKKEKDSDLECAKKGYLDEKNLYIITQLDKLEEEKLTYFGRVIDLKTLKVIYTKNLGENLLLENKK